MKNESGYEAQRWLRQAKEDLVTVQALITTKRYYMVCFISQQVAEKGLKAFLYAQGEELVIGHPVSSLCRRCAGYSKRFTQLHDAIKNLDQYYLGARYPNGLPDDIPASFFNASDAARARGMAQKALAAVEALIG